MKILYLLKNTKNKWYGFSCIRQVKLKFSALGEMFGAVFVVIQNVVFLADLLCLIVVLFSGSSLSILMKATTLGDRSISYHSFNP